MKLKHNIPLGTNVSFEDGYVYETADYQTLLGPCPPNCKADHDCYDEPYIAVKRWIGSAMPLSKLKFIYDPNTHKGRTPTCEELSTSSGEENV